MSKEVHNGIVVGDVNISNGGASPLGDSKATGKYNILFCLKYITNEDTNLKWVKKN